ncbi:MAG: endonuclease NucS [Planctomycetia bacterium]|nr:endonuclease NucS [Planctomycetia bacterium]
MARERAIQTLRDILAKVDHQSSDEMYRVAAEIRDAKASVLEEYRSVFAIDNLDHLNAEDFRSFLLFRNNKHWDSMHRQGGWMTSDMQKLREALRILLDERSDIRKRLNRLRPPAGDPMVRGLGRAVITAILQVAYPDKYGVWNNTAESALKLLGIWPDMPRGASFGDRYVVLNRVLHEYAEEIGIDLWTLDMLWWRVEPHMPRGREADEVDDAAETDEATMGLSASGVFGLEKYLQEFLLDNWQSVELLQDWVLLEEDGEIIGSHYNTREIGEIDLLAKRRDGGAWLVIELKKDQTSDTTVGQVLRYMGWVRRNLANGGDVRGLVVSHDIDRRLQYALDGQSKIECMTYEVNFQLNAVPTLEQGGVTRCSS